MPYSYDDDLIREIRESTDIVAIISEYVELKSAGSNMKGLCPFHSEKTPSMVVSTSKQMFHCFGCGEGGDVISFLMKYKNVDFRSVIEELADRANIELRQKTDLDLKRDRERELIYEINRQAAIFYYRNLSGKKEPLNYLDNRGISKETVKRFGLGYSLEGWDSLLNHLKSKGYRIEDIEKSGLIIKHREKNSYYDRFRGRIIFPIWNVNSKIIGFGGRLLRESDRQPKYLNSPDTDVFLKGRNLYGLNLIKDKLRGKRIILVEGYMDVIALSQRGLQRSVASLGTALTSEQVKLIKRYTEDIAIAYDFDKAGINASRKAIAVIKKEGIIPKVVKLEEGMDPDDYISRHGVEAFRDRVAEAVHYMDFLIEQEIEKVNINSLEGRLSFVKAMRPYLKDINSPVETDMYVTRVAELAKVDRQSIVRELGLYKGSFSKKYDLEKKVLNKPTVPKQNSNIASRVELEFLKLLLESGNTENLKGIDINEFEDKLNAEILRFLLEQGNFNLDALRENEHIRSRLVEVESVVISMAKDKLDRAIEDYRKKLKLRYLEKKKKFLLEEIKEHEKSSSADDTSMLRFRELCRQLTEIDRDMKKC